MTFQWWEQQNFIYTRVIIDSLIPKSFNHKQLTRWLHNCIILFSQRSYKEVYTHQRTDFLHKFTHNKMITHSLSIHDNFLNTKSVLQAHYVLLLDHTPCFKLVSQDNILNANVQLLMKSGRNFQNFCQNEMLFGCFAPICKCITAWWRGSWDTMLKRCIQAHLITSTMKYYGNRFALTSSIHSFRYLCVFGWFIHDISYLIQLSNERCSKKGVCMELL